MLVLTVDVEDWYQTSDFNIPVTNWYSYERRVVNNTMRMLDVFDEYGAKGTFFVLGCVAQEYPDLIREIVARGHEIGSHGGWHQMLNTMDLSTIREDLLFSKGVLEDISGRPVTCYRAPSWSLGPERYEVYYTLEELGFTCDSSIQPFKTPLSGVNLRMRGPFYPVIRGEKINVLEFPSTTVKLGFWNLPFAGGLYLRTMPVGLVKRGLKNVEKKFPAMVYVHPWEIDINQPHISDSLINRFTHYYHLGKTESKIRYLLERFSTVTIREAASAMEYPIYSL